MNEVLCLCSEIVDIYSPELNTANFTSFLLFQRPKAHHRLTHATIILVPIDNLRILKLCVGYRTEFECFKFW